MQPRPRWLKMAFDVRPFHQPPEVPPKTSFPSHTIKTCLPQFSVLRPIGLVTCISVLLTHFILPAKMSYLRTELPHNPDFPAVAEALRKLIKRTDELERESKNAQQKISQYEKDIVKLSNRCDTFGNKIQQLESKNLMLENRCKAV